MTEHHHAKSPLPPDQAKPKSDDPLAAVRVAAQALHKAISDAAAKRAETLNAELEALPAKVKAVADSLAAMLDAEDSATKQHLKEAHRFLESTQEHVARGLESSGQAMQTALRQTLTDARAAVQKISEGVAEKRSTEARRDQK